jgi:hypothetical protein
MLSASNAVSFNHERLALAESSSSLSIEWYPSRNLNVTTQRERDAWRSAVQHTSQGCCAVLCHAHKSYTSH